MKLPLPKLDPNRQWGSDHYLCELVDVTDQTALSLIAPPPSSILKEEFSQAQGKRDSEKFIKVASRKALLPPDDTRIWIEHLSEIVRNRKRGAAKAAATRRAKIMTTVTQAAGDSSDKTSMCYCGRCEKEYLEEPDQSELWIACDLCDKWYCCD